MILDCEAMTKALCRGFIVAGLYGSSALAGMPDEIRVPGEIPGTFSPCRGRPDLRMPGRWSEPAGLAAARAGRDLDRRR